MEVSDYSSVNRFPYSASPIWAYGMSHAIDNLSKFPLMSMCTILRTGMSALFYSSVPGKCERGSAQYRVLRIRERRPEDPSDAGARTFGFINRDGG
jgi:hypothetical protein